MFKPRGGEESERGHCANKGTRGARGRWGSCRERSCTFNLQTCRDEKWGHWGLESEDVTHGFHSERLSVWVLPSSGGGCFALVLKGRKEGTTSLLLTSMHSIQYPL